jgi:hypothetical protein
MLPLAAIYRKAIYRKAIYRKAIYRKAIYRKAIYRKAIYRKAIYRPVTLCRPFSLPRQFGGFMTLFPQPRRGQNLFIPALKRRLKTARHRPGEAPGSATAYT